jgi:hypothetical protein
MSARVAGAELRGSFLFRYVGERGMGADRERRRIIHRSGCQKKSHRVGETNKIHHNSSE